MPSVLEQLGVPVRNIDRVEERQPLFVARQAEGLLHERGPFRPGRLSGQDHARLLRSPAPLAAITLMTGTNNILPGRGSALGPGNDMVEVELVAGEFAPAILARAVIAGIDVIAAESDLPLGNPIIT